MRSGTVYTIGTETIQIEEVDGTVRVFSKNGTGEKSELYDTQAACRLGWKVQTQSPTRLILWTGDLGSFDIYDAGTGCLVVPSNTFLSKDKSRAVTLRIDTTSVQASIGKTSPPFSDLWLSDEKDTPAAKIDGMSVHWVTET